ncbi:MAG TPA: 5-formyltetrahydrofolate cyclo-ligase [Bauldia sp.]|nr:5-formyltetrahydrofolate cyclo-ligase [Bauldia sp.]
MASKSELRDQALKRRDATDAAFRARASATIAARVLPIIAALAPRTIAAYVAMRSEADPLPIIEAAHRQGAEIGLPVIGPGATLLFRRYEPGHRLVPGGFGTMIPVEAAPVIEPELFVVPVVGFDRAGTRLGYGKGHYDRAIGALHDRGLRPPLVGIAFALQEVEMIPHEPHDVRLDVIVTEDEILDFRDQVGKR